MSSSLVARARELTGLANRAPARLHRGADGRTVRMAEVPALSAAAQADTGSLADLPFHNAAEAPRTVVASRGAKERWQNVTAREFADQVAGLAKGLIEAGVAPGDRIAVMSRTSYAWTLIDFAGWAAGAVVVPIYPTSSPAQVHWILADSRSRACFTETPEHAAAVQDASAGLDDPFDIWRLDEQVIDRLTELGRAVPDSELAARREALTPDHPATLIYTSGTTGRPKGCELTHRNFIAECDTVVELLLPVFEKVSGQQPSTLLFLPLAHVLGRMVEVACVRARIRLGHAPSIKPAELRADMAGFHPTFLLGVPYLFEKIYHTGRSEAEAIGRASSFDRAARIARRYGQALLSALDGGPGPDARLKAAHALYDLLVYRRIRKALGGDIRFAVSGGSSLSTDMMLFFAGAGVLIYEGYGLTETTAAITVNPPLRPRPGSVGMPIPGAGVRISDEGEIEVRGGMVFRRYLGIDGEQLDAEGWFATGDLGRLDEDGYLYVTGRRKEIIVTNGGKNVSPGPMEDRLRVHPLIGQCMIVGDDKPFVAALITLDAEAVDAFIEKQRGGDQYDGRPADHPQVRAEIQAAVDEVNATVSRAESVRKFAVLDEEFTEENGLLTPSLKIKRHRIAEVHGESIAALYATSGPAPDTGLESAAG